MLLQSATEKLRLHWRSNLAVSRLSQFATIRNWKVAAPLKVWSFWDLYHIVYYNPQLKSCGSIEGIPNILYTWYVSTIRNWKVAAPLKVRNREYPRACILFNPQLKSCGSIEGESPPAAISAKLLQSATEKLRLHWRLMMKNAKTTYLQQSATEKLRLHWRTGQKKTFTAKFRQSATEKLRLHWRHSRHGIDDLHFIYNPQLKSCGSIEGCQALITRCTITTAIRNWKVAAPLKVIHLWDYIQYRHTIRNWKVAAPLKGLWWLRG